MPVDPAALPAGTPDGRLAERIASLERQLRTLTSLVNGGAAGQIPVVAALPASGREGRLVKLAGGGVYVDTGAAWVAL